MAQLFAITPASDSLILDKGRGEISYTVFNTLGSPVRGRGKVIALGSTKQEWLTLGGEAERDFSSSGTQQYRIEFVAPEGTSAGKYPFRLDVLSVVNPDEDFTEGPSVTAEIEASAPVQPSKKSFPMWIIPLVLGILIIGGLVTWLALRNGSDETDNTNEVAQATPTPSPSASPGGGGGGGRLNINQVIPRPSYHATERETPTPTPPPPFSVNTVTLEASPSQHEGKCPRTINFRGTITANNQGGVVQYRIRRWNGSLAPPQSVTIPPGGSRDVNWSDEIGKSVVWPMPQMTFDVSAKLLVFSPNNVESNEAKVKLVCKP